MLPNIWIFDTYSIMMLVGVLSAFALIWNEWFRHEQTNAACNVHRTNTVHSSEIPNANAWSASNYVGQLPPVVRYKDYFSTANVTPQKGPDVLIPISDLRTSTNQPILQYPAFDMQGLYSLGATVQERDASGVTYLGDYHGIGDQFVGWNAMTFANPGTINDLRMAYALQAYRGRDLWDGSRISPVGRADLIVDFRCNDNWNINLEGNGNITTDHFNSKHADNADWYLNYLVGATYKFGKGYTEKTVARQTEPEPTPVAMCNVCNKPLTDCQYNGNHPKCQTCGKYLHDCEYNGNHPAPKPAPAVYNVFFERNKSIVSAEEDLKIKAAAEYLKANPEAKASIVSYADVNTGNTKLNQKLSEDRSAVVAKYLIENYGIAADRISTESLGDTKQPFSENDKNRVSIITTEVK